MTIRRSEIDTNPFAVPTPENLTADEIVSLFVPYPEFENLQVSGHQFLHGHRGSGKSMMLKMMSPDSLSLWRQCKFDALPYFGVYMSIKTTELNNPEYKRLECEVGGTVLSEHVLTTKLLSALFLAVEKHCIEYISENKLEAKLREVITTTLFNKLKYAGWNVVLSEAILTQLDSPKDSLKYVIELIDEIHNSTVQYIKRRSFSNESLPYQGALLGFQDVLLPIVKALSMSKIVPEKVPVYFLLDDADNLTEQQTQILNTWVSYRTTDYLSLKISTQLNYKTYKTTSGIKIESPHDFSSINFTSVHTGSVKERYPKLVEDIVRKRLARYGVANPDPYVFFPEDEAQKEAIQKIALEIKDNWVEGQSGYRPGDDAYRFARPEYIRRLSGASKQGARYRYAGFEQLVHVSSGIIRFFLEPASRMFTEQLLKTADRPLIEISTSIQDQELRKQADQLLLQGFDNLELEAENDVEQLSQSNNENNTPQLNDVVRLRNLVKGIGAIFKAHIMDAELTQRRVFSFTISGSAPSKELKSILKLGIIQGYFYLDSIGTKDGLGREKLYVLTRRLAPAFSLDPIGFSAHLQLQSNLLSEICERPSAFIGRLKRKGVSETDSSCQLSLLDGGNDE